MDATVLFVVGTWSPECATRIFFVWLVLIAFVFQFILFVYSI